MRSDHELLRLLTLARDHLEMDAAFVCELTDTKQVYRAAVGEVDAFGLVLDAGPRREDTYCDLVVAGQLPNVIADAAADPRVRELPVTRVAGIGAYVGVPLILADGRLYGTLCCLSSHPDPRLGERDGNFLALLAGMVCERVDVLEATRREDAEVRHVIDTGDVEIALQPIVGLTSGTYRGAEALARFPGSSRCVEEMFALAARAGLGPELELLALRRALARLDDLPEGVYLAVNMSPEGIADPRFHALLIQGGALDYLVLEVTEHAPVERYAALHEVLDPLRAMGLRVAVDDVGSGYASFRHVLQLRPDIIKIDRSLVDGIARDPALRTIAGNIVLLGLDLRATIVAEGIEDPEDLEVLKTLGADLAQGNLIARPSTDPADWMSWATKPRGPGRVEPPIAQRTPTDTGEGLVLGLPDTAEVAHREATTFQQACEFIADDLVAHGLSMPSIYMVAGRVLRCVAARGYFQVVDGFEIGVGVIGRVAATGHAALVSDVTTEGEFIAAALGIASEAAVPVWADGRIVAVINAESRTPLPASALDLLGAAADGLSTWLAEHGGAPTMHAQDELVRASRDLVSLSDAGRIRHRALVAAVELSGLSSAAVVLRSADDGRWSVTAAVGPLAEVVTGWAPSELRSMADWVRRGTSSHTPGGHQPDSDYAFLTANGIGALAVHPLTFDGVIGGLLIVLDRRRQQQAQPVEHSLVEQLCVSTAAALRAATSDEPPTDDHETDHDRTALIDTWWRRLSPAQRKLARAALSGHLTAGLVESLRRAGIDLTAYAPPGIPTTGARHWMPRDVRQYINRLDPAQTAGRPRDAADIKIQALFSAASDNDRQVLPDCTASAVGAPAEIKVPPSSTPMSAELP